METTIAASVVRVRRPPAYEPPYDDERHPEAWLHLPQPQLDLGAVRRPPARHPADPPAGATAPAPQPTGPPARAAVTRFLRAWLEILNGYRPLGHLRTLTNPLDAAGVLAATTQAVRRFNRLRPPAGRAAPPARGPRLRIGRVRLCQPRPDVAEVAAVLMSHGRAWAGALRLQHLDGRWLCVSAEVLWGGQTPQRRPA